MRVFVGIDPGLTGAVGVVDADGQPLSVFDTPTIRVQKAHSEGYRTEPAVAEMRDVLLEIAFKYETVMRVVLEKVRPMPKTKHGAAAAEFGEGESKGAGALANHSLGLGYGLWWGICVALALPLERIDAQSWRPRMLAGLPRGKEVNRQHAIERWPAFASNLKLKKHHGRADALLLAEWGRRQV